MLAGGWPAEARDLVVLDLACGSGYLLDLIKRRQRVPITLIGVDMSSVELELARARLGDAARLLEVRAQDIALPDASIDYAVCHLAFMLMQPIEPVIEKLGALLKPGGSFAAIVPGGASRSEASLIFLFGTRQGNESGGRAADRDRRRQNDIRSWVAGAVCLIVRLLRRLV